LHQKLIVINKRNLCPKIMGLCLNWRMVNRQNLIPLRGTNQRSHKLATNKAERTGDYRNRILHAYNARLNAEDGG
jgi:hypothetical protein